MEKEITNIVYKNKSYKSKIIKTNKPNTELSTAIHSKISNNVTYESVVKSKFSGYDYQGYVVLDNSQEVIGEFYIFDN